MSKRRAASDLGGGSLFGAPPASRSPASLKDEAFAADLKALNSQFAVWVAEQAASKPGELWRDGAKAYLKYAEELLDALGDSAGPGANADAPAAPSLFGAPPAVPGAFSFGAKPAGASDGSAADRAAAAKPALPAFFFGGGAGGSAGGGSLGGGGGSALPAFSFGGSAAGAPPASMLGSFGAGASAAAGGGDDEAEEEEEATEEVELGAGTDVEILHKAPTKLMSMGDTRKWVDRGAGTLTLRRSTAAGASLTPFVVFTSSAGKVLVNAPLVKGMGPTCPPKTPANLIMFLISTLPSADGSGQTEERGLRLFKFESPDAMGAFKAVVLEHTTA